MSMTYGHSPTESVVAILQGTERDTGLDLVALEQIASDMRRIRKKYAKFEGSLRGVDARILIAQVPGGMLTNMESQLKQQKADHRIDEVLAEIPRVRKDLGYIPLVTPTSQIVGTQAVLNVLSGERYKSISKETQGILRGEYGAAPAPFDAALQASVLDGADPIACRPADLLDPEMARLTAELEKVAAEQGIRLESGERLADDVLTYALFTQVGLKFLRHRGDPSKFEPAPSSRESSAPKAPTGDAIYTVTVEGHAYTVTVNEGGDITGIVAPTTAMAGAAQAKAPLPVVTGAPLPAPLAGNIVRVVAAAGSAVREGELLLILEAMKMETEVRAPRAGTIGSVAVKPGDTVAVGDTLLTIG
jgi:oxaloacetate decarboxylase (Na+ extruding) subunit alpha